MAKYTYDGKSFTSSKEALQALLDDENPQMKAILDENNYEVAGADAYGERYISENYMNSNDINKEVSGLKDWFYQKSKEISDKIFKEKNQAKEVQRTSLLNTFKQNIREFITNGRPKDLYSGSTYAIKDSRGYEIGYLDPEGKPFPIPDGRIGSEETRENAKIFAEIMNEPEVLKVVQDNQSKKEAERIAEDERNQQLEVEKINVLKEKIRDFLKEGRPNDTANYVIGTHAIKDDNGNEIGYIGPDKEPFPIPDGRIGSEETRKNAAIFAEVMNEPEMLTIKEFYQEIAKEQAKLERAATAEETRVKSEQETKSVEVLKERIRDFLKEGRPNDTANYVIGTHAIKDDNGNEIGYIGPDKEPFPIPDGRIGSEETRKNAAIFAEVMNEPDIRVLHDKEFKEEVSFKQEIREFITNGRPKDLYSGSTYAIKDSRGYEIGYLDPEGKPFSIPDGRIGSEETRKNAAIFAEVMNELEMQKMNKKGFAIDKSKVKHRVQEISSRGIDEKQEAKRSLSI